MNSSARALPAPLANDLRPAVIPLPRPAVAHAALTWLLIGLTAAIAVSIVTATTRTARTPTVVAVRTGSLPPTVAFPTHALAGIRGY